MSTLTKKERDGLEDVFLSIHDNQKRYEKIKHLSSLIISSTPRLNAKELLEKAKLGIKSRKISHYLSYLLQKKKNLSK